ncbi:MAG TPA: RNA polymerase sigma factor [Candidatus Kapabacteria bacterium]|jgi:RNA polymerase sigma-70 factor (ECF subfamily)|nr:RNA polymerase sigma factor [Candidatus Kapabacteria bacterium]
MSPTERIPQLDESREEELIAAFVRGDMAGFKFVYTRFRQRVMSYCVYYMGDQTLAEDAFQEVFSRVYTRREQLREPKALKSWLLMITRTVCLNLLRTSKFTPDFVSITSFEDPEHGSEPPELSVEGGSEVIADDMLKVVLSRIAPIYREAFLLREFEGYDYDAIARMTGATEMNVKVRITRAKKQLRVLLEPYYRYEANQTKSRGRSKSKKNEAAQTIRSDEMELRDEEEPVDNMEAFGPGAEGVFAQ